jgi:uncharacterized membrane protein (UPF0127 family)
MKYVTITNLSQPQVQPILARFCQSFLCQLRGLMFQPSLPAEKGLLLVQEEESRWGSSIHMMFMRIDLAVIWINNNLEVVDVRLAHRWRPGYLPKKPARYVLEANITRLNDFHIGDKLRLDEAWVD